MRNPITGQIAGPVPGVTIDGAQVYTVNLYPAGPYTKTGSIYTPTTPTIASVVYLDSNTSDTLSGGGWVDVWQQNGLYYMETPVRNPSASATGTGVDFWCDLFDRADQTGLGPYWSNKMNGIIISEEAVFNTVLGINPFYMNPISLTNYNVKVIISGTTEALFNNGFILINNNNAQLLYSINSATYTGVNLYYGRSSGIDYWGINVNPTGGGLTSIPLSSDLTIDMAVTATTLTVPPWSTQSFSVGQNAGYIGIWALHNIKSIKAWRSDMPEPADQTGFGKHNFTAGYNNYLDGYHTKTGTNPDGSPIYTYTPTAFDPES